MGYIKFIVFLGSVILMACSKKDPEEHLQKGVEYFNKGEYEKAVLELKTSNQSDKKLAETYYYLALLDEKNRQYKAMSENLKKVIELSPGHVDARLKYGKVQLLLGQSDIALEQANTILKDASRNLDAQILKASVLIKQKKQAEAKAIIESVLKENPIHIDGLMLQSFLYMENNDFDSALNSINTAIEHDRKNISLWFSKIQINTKRKKVDGIINDYQELVSLFPDNQDFKITLAKIYARSGKNKEAEDLLNSLIEIKPGDINLKLLYLDFLKSSYPERVKEKFQSYTEQYKENSSALVSIATWATIQKDFDSAKSVLHRVIELDKNKNQVLLAKTLLGKIAFGLKDFDTTKKIVEDILSENANYTDAKVLQARLLFSEAKYDETIDILNKILWDQPNSEEVLILLGKTFISKGQENEAEKQFKKVLEINPANLEAVSYLYDTAMASGSLGYAQEISEKALRIQPTNLFLLENTARVYIAEKKWDEAKGIVDKIKQLDSSQAINLAKFLQAKIYQGQDECVKAIDLYKDLTVLVSGSYEILGDMTQCYEKLNKKDSMIAFLNDLLKENSRNVSAGIILSNLLVSNKQFEKSELLLRNLVTENNKIPELYAALAKVKLAQGDNGSAISNYEEGLKSNPGNTKLMVSLAELYDKQGDYHSAISIYETLLKSNPGLDVAANNLAAILIERESNEEGLIKAIKLSEKFKNSKQAAFKDTYAWALIKKGDINSAIELLNEVVISEPNIPVFRYHLAVAHHNNEDNGSALAELREALDLAAKGRDFADKKAAEALLTQLTAKKAQ